MRFVFVLSSCKFILRLAFLIIIFGSLTGCTTVGGGADYQAMLQTLSYSFPAIWKLLLSLSYVMGFMFALKGVYSLKSYGESRTMMSSNTSLKGPVLNFLAAAMLIYLPSAFQLINTTFFGTPNILSYTSGGIGNLSQQSITIVLGVVQIIGLIAFIRGWVYIAKAGENTGGQPVIGKALTHIIAGVFAINIVQFVNMIQATFGLG